MIPEDHGEGRAILTGYYSLVLIKKERRERERMRVERSPKLRHVTVFKQAEYRRTWVCKAES